MTPAELRQRVVITVPELADVLGVDERTVRRAIAHDQILAIKVGKKTLIPVAKLLPLLGLDAGTTTDEQAAGLRLVAGDAAG